MNITIDKGNAVPDQDQIRALHVEYLRLVGGDLTLTLDRMFWWGQWMAKGWRIPELRLVIRHIQDQIKAGRRYPGALRWSNLIQQADKFEEELCLTKAEKRNSKPQRTPRERVIAQARPTVAAVPKANGDAKPIGELIAALRNAVNTQ